MASAIQKEGQNKKKNTEQIIIKWSKTTIPAQQAMINK